MTSFDPAEFMKQAANIAVTNPRTPRDMHLQFRDLLYTARLALVVKNTRDAGRCMESSLFNELVNGMKTVKEVCDRLAEWHEQVTA